MKTKIIKIPMKWTCNNGSFMVSGDFTIGGGYLCGGMVREILPDLHRSRRKKRLITVQLIPMTAKKARSEYEVHARFQVNVDGIENYLRFEDKFGYLKYISMGPKLAAQFKDKRYYGVHVIY